MSSATDSRAGTQRTMVGAGKRRAVVGAIAAAGLASAALLSAQGQLALPGLESLELLARFFSHALRPALDYGSPFVPVSAPPLLLQVATATWRTVQLAVAAMSLALPVALLLGFAGASAWWRLPGPGGRAVLRRLGPLVYAPARVVMTLARSVHELLWALLFLAAVGLSDTAAVLAIAIPYAGTLGKVFSEMIDEAPRDAAVQLTGSGATAAQAFSVALLPRALPDMAAYSFYRFECALRSAAVLGFFGPETLGKFIRLAWNESLYAELWTYLYALFTLIALSDMASRALRQRFLGEAPAR
ncbi:MAG: ABC transporter permease subunit [Proteobacteria bacterium]|nr:ABC transporter permease subunit [Pseudomonadota bacterium]